MFRLFQEFRKKLGGCAPANCIGKYYATDDPKFWSPHPDKYINRERAKTYTYKFNDHGFRCDDFSKSSEYPILFLGCSNTCGVGLEIENTWQYILLDKITTYTEKKIPLWSLATAGSSIDKQALLLEKHIDTLQPRFIFFLIPNIYRRLICLNNEFVEYLPAHRFGLWRPKAVEKKVGKFDSAFTEEDFAAFESYKNLLLINQLATKHGSTVYWDSWCDDSDYNILKAICDQLSQFQILQIPVVSGLCARDGAHAGFETNRRFAEDTFEKIKNDL